MKEVVSTKLPRNEKHLVRALAEERGTNLSGFLRDLLRLEIEHRFGVASRATN